MGLFKRLFGGSPESDAPSPEIAKTPRLRVANVQGIGRREQQEDSFSIVNAFDLAAIAERGLFAVLTDGMGGMADGKQASEMAAGSFVELFRSMDIEAEIPPQLADGTRTISDRIFTEFSGQSGTTVVAVHVKDGFLHWLSVGDSAIFLMRDGGVFQLNREHTCLNQLYLQELYGGEINKSRAENDPDAARLTAFLGISRLAELDLALRPLPLLPGDSLLLCSDGISGVLSPAELLECLSSSPEEACALIESFIAEKNLPGQDNYTGIIINYA